MAISNALASNLNRMNRAAKNASLGTAFQTSQTNITSLQSACSVIQGQISAIQIGSVIKTGSQTVGTSGSGAQTLTIWTGLPTAVGAMLQVVRSGSTSGSGLIPVAMSSGSLTSHASANWSFLSTDVVTWIAF